MFRQKKSLFAKTSNTGNRTGDLPMATLIAYPLGHNVLLMFDIFLLCLTNPYYSLTKNIDPLGRFQGRNNLKIFFNILTYM